MRKFLDNLHLRNFNRENPGFMLNREIYMPRKIPGIRYLILCKCNSHKIINRMDTYMYVPSVYHRLFTIV